jgi:HEAT repeat protein
MMVELALVLVVVSLLGYLLFGTALDLFSSRRDREEHQAMEVLSRALYADRDALPPMMAELRSISNRVLFGLAVHIPLHFDDLLSKRLLDIIGATTARQRVLRLSRSRLWHRRVRAARLSQILPESQDVTERLLGDSRSPVRAAVIESFGVDKIAQYADELLEALSDGSKSVRFTAQQALLRGDGRLVAPVARALPTMEGEEAVRGLEVASNLRDPRLLPIIRAHADSPNPKVRRLVAHATPYGVQNHELYFLVPLLDDEEASVRVAVIETIARLQADWFAARLGAAMSDPSWEVRRAAGTSLAQLGPVGMLVLRKTVQGDDPYAHDMARQVLDGLRVQGLIPQEQVRSPEERLDSLADWASA